MHRIAEWKYHHHHSRRRHSTSRRQQLALDNDDNNRVSNDDDSDGDDDNDQLHNMMTNNWTSILLQSTLHVPDDFSSAGTTGMVGDGGGVGGEQLSRAILLWHLSAMAGNVESAMGTFCFIDIIIIEAILLTTFVLYAQIYGRCASTSLFSIISIHPKHWDIVICTPPPVD